MQDTHDHELARVMDIVEGVVAGEDDTQSRCKMLTERRGLRKMPKPLTSAFDLIDQPRRRVLGSFAGDIKPDFGNVGFGRVG
jgi:hypothetical protein